jgi:hypothetical protein
MDRVPIEVRHKFKINHIGGIVNIRSLHDRVVVKREPEERRSAVFRGVSILANAVKATLGRSQASS